MKAFHCSQARRSPTAAITFSRGPAVFPIEPFNGDGIYHYSPYGQYSQLLTAIRKMGPFKGNVPHGVIQLFQGQYFADLLQPARESFRRKKSPSQEELWKGEQVGK